MRIALDSIGITTFGVSAASDAVIAIVVRISGSIGAGAIGAGAVLDGCTSGTEPQPQVGVSSVAATVQAHTSRRSVAQVAVQVARITEPPDGWSGIGARYRRGSAFAIDPDGLVATP
ncbi:MAG TPA: hypothetical protein VEL07_12045 [Planctomycetota bacterium]|nr:hypothetical protein [Planctomycetota bacterium]